MKIEIEGLNKIYPNGHHAIKDLNLTIENGMFGLLGPNGAGKSSLMRILVALQDATSGRVLIDGVDLAKDRKQIRKILGYLPQDFRFFADLTVWEFLDYGGRLAGMKRSKHRRGEVDRLLEEVGLYDVRNRKANHLSGGMKRRLGIAQALIGDPKVIIVDEPTTGLDPEERIRFRNLLSTMADRDVIIILSTHIVGDISSSCHDMAILEKGVKVYKGSPGDIITSAKGNVWQMQATNEEFNVINEQFPVISTIPTNSGWELQLVAKDLGKYRDRGILIEPNLEHAYVNFMENVLNKKWHES